MTVKEYKNSIEKSLPDPLKRVLRIVVKTFKLYLYNDLPVFAASTSFFMIISAIPLFMLLFSTISLIPSIHAEDIAKQINLLFPNIPYVLEIVRYVMHMANELSTSNVLYVNIITALISGSTCLFAFIIGIKRVHYITRTSNYALIKIMTILNIFVLYATVTLTLILFVLGKMFLNYVTQYFPFATNIFTEILSYRYLAISILLIILTMSLYTCCSNFQRHMLKNIYGSVFATFSWLIISRLFSNYYIAHPISQNVYGSLTGLIIALLWLFVCINLVFIGACVNEAMYPQSVIEMEKKIKSDELSKQIKN